jgi:hypothetical protein
MSSRRWAPLAASLVLAVVAGGAEAQPDVRFDFKLGLDGPCFPAAEEILRRGGYAPDRLRDFLDVPRHRGYPGEIRGWQVWAYPRTCDGAVVMDFDTPGVGNDPAACSLLQVWTRGSCPFPSQSAQR